VTNYNNSLGQSSKQQIDLKGRNYREQLIVFINTKGEKVVYVNCFCKVDDDDWKTDFFKTYDGGNCFFNFETMLQQKTFFDMKVS
jgi:hypothetical protein